MQIKMKVYEIITVDLKHQRIFLSKEDAITYGDSLGLPYKTYEREVY